MSEQSESKTEAALSLAYIIVDDENGGAKFAEVCLSEASLAMQI